MKCPNCGNKIDNNEKYCCLCGSKVEEQKTDAAENAMNLLLENAAAAQQVQQAEPSAETVQQPQVDNSNLSMKEFYKGYVSKKSASWVTAMIVVCFASAAVALICLIMGQTMSILDLALYASMGLFLLTDKKWIYALIPTVYSGFFSLLTLLGGGALTGVFALIAGIMSTIVLRKFNKAYKAYKETGAFPAQEI